MVVDTVGELAALYSLAKVAFVGGSLVRHGGQNPLEPAQFRVPVLMGPHMENFRDIIQAGRASGAFVPSAFEEVCAQIGSHMRVAGVDRAGELALKIYQSQAGATARTVTALLALVQERAG